MNDMYLKRDGYCCVGGEGIFGVNKSLWRPVKIWQVTYNWGKSLWNSEIKYNHITMAYDCKLGNNTSWMDNSKTKI